MGIVKIVRSGRIRRWMSQEGKHHTEEVYDVYVDDKKLSRGFCKTTFDKIFKINLSEKEVVWFKIEKISGVSLDARLLFAKEVGRMDIVKRLRDFCVPRPEEFEALAKLVETAEKIDACQLKVEAWMDQFTVGQSEEILANVIDEMHALDDEFRPLLAEMRQALSRPEVKDGNS
uniref:Uncharacterized protein n=1 Tax=viral metagenome TaxID=1070528 RepID=A0A6M3LQ79_9ZZZZ